jgi:hypothetical protein
MGQSRNFDTLDNGGKPVKPQRLSGDEAEVWPKPGRPQRSILDNLQSV